MGCFAQTAYPHQDQSFGFGFLGLRQVKIHLITIKVGIVRCAHALIEAECSVRFDPCLHIKKKKELFNTSFSVFEMITFSNLLFDLRLQGHHSRLWNMRI